MGAHSNSLAWRIPWTEEPGRLWFIMLQRVGHDLVTTTIYIYNGILLSHKKDEIMPFAATSTDLEIIIQSEVNQRKTNAR